MQGSFSIMKVKNTAKRSCLARLGELLAVDLLGVLWYNKLKLISRERNILNLYEHDKIYKLGGYLCLNRS